MASPPTETPRATSPSPNGHASPAPLGRAADLVVLRDPRSAAAEAYRTLALNLQFSALDQPLRTVAVTSPSAGEGKTTTVANLAVVLAEGGRRVIVVDADLRRPGLHSLFGLRNDEGLTSVMLEGAGSGTLPLRETEVSDLYVLPSGPLPPNPAELLGSRRMDLVLRELAEVSDIVLFDTAPAAALADAPILAARVDGVLLVVGAGKTRRDLARQTKEHLERVKARILGVVLTGARVDAKLYGYGGDSK